MSKVILVADDEPSILLSIQFLLEKEGYTVIQAKDGEEALNHLQNIQPNLILLDVMMPKHNGFDVCQKVRQLPGYATLPIIMLTAKGRAIDREKGLAMGVTEYITKPFSTRELLITIRQYIEQ